MRRVIFLAAAAALLAGCAGTADPSGTWINQAAIDAASKDGKLREACSPMARTWNGSSTARQAKPPSATASNWAKGP